MTLQTSFQIIDQETGEALREHFQGLSEMVTLAIYGKGHNKYNELKALASDVTLCSTQIELKEEDKQEFETTHGLGCEILCGGKTVGIRFAGIPAGHEFSSLILAILHSQGKGKQLDDVLKQQVKELNGPIQLRTFVSLSCENCPDVVQLLNQFALTHGEFQHTMIDGDLAPDEVARLKIGAVPAVFAGDELLLSGKVSFVQLLEKLKAKFGTQPAHSHSLSASHTKHFDVLVVGGGPAGVSAAIYSARKGLKTGIVAERMGGQVADTQGIENMISYPYTVGAQLVADMAKHLNEYPVELLENRRVEKFIFANELFASQNTAVLSSSEQVTFQQLIFATGAKWRELNVPGEKDYLGRGVAFCPHCDGPLYKGKEIAVIGGGNSGVEAALDLAGTSSKITLLEFAADLKADEILVSRLRQTPNITVITNAQTKEIVGDEKSVKGLRYKDRISGQDHFIELAGVFVQIGLIPNSATLKEHVNLSAFGEVQIDTHGRTSKPGVYAAGDVTTVPFKQIIISMGEGAKAALAAFEDRLKNQVV